MAASSPLSSHHHVPDLGRTDSDYSSPEDIGTDPDMPLSSGDESSSSAVSSGDEGCLPAKSSSSTACVLEAELEMEVLKKGHEHGAANGKRSPPEHDSSESASDDDDDADNEDDAAVADALLSSDDPKAADRVLRAIRPVDENGYGYGSFHGTCLLMRENEFLVGGKSPPNGALLRFDYESGLIKLPHLKFYPAMSSHPRHMIEVEENGTKFLYISDYQRDLRLVELNEDGEFVVSEQGRKKERSVNSGFLKEKTSKGMIVADCFAVLANPKHVFVAGGGRAHQVKVYNHVLEMVSLLSGHKEGKSVTALAVLHSRKANIVVTGGKDRYVKYWDYRRRTCLSAMKGHRGSIYCLRVEGSTVYSSSRESIRVWNTRGQQLCVITANKGEEIREFQVHRGIVYAALVTGRVVVWGTRGAQKSLRIAEFDCSAAEDEPRFHPKLKPPKTPRESSSASLSSSSSNIDEKQTGKTKRGGRKSPTVVKRSDYTTSIELVKHRPSILVLQPYRLVIWELNISGFEHLLPRQDGQPHLYRCDPSMLTTARKLQKGSCIIS